MGRLGVKEGGKGGGRRDKDGVVLVVHAARLARCTARSHSEKEICRVTKREGEEKRRKGNCALCRHRRHRRHRRAATETKYEGWPSSVRPSVRIRPSFGLLPSVFILGHEPTPDEKGEGGVVAAMA